MQKMENCWQDGGKLCYDSFIVQSTLEGLQMIRTDRKDVITRTEALCRAFGWQGGTIHQIAEETGCSAYDLIYAKDEGYSESHWKGSMAYSTNTLEFNRANLLEKNKGNLQYWLGVATAVQTCIKMKQPTVKKF